MAKKKIAKRKPAAKTRSTRNKGSTAHHSRGEIEVIARAAIVHNGQVLLCENLKHHYFFLPGGHVEFGESAAAAAERELEEELGAKVRMGSLAMVSEGVFDAKRRHHEINLVFHVEPPHPFPRAMSKPKSREKHIGFRWVELAAAQDLDIRPTAVKAWLTTGMGGDGIEWVSETV